MTEGHYTDSYFFDDIRSLEDVTNLTQHQAALLDKEFLLRATMLYDWDRVISFCEFLQDEISFLRTRYAPCEAARRAAALSRAVASQLLARDQWCNNVLHVACYNQPPVRAVQALLATASVVQRPLLLHQEKARDGSTPLLVACATGASHEVIQALLELEGGGAMVFTVEEMGATPLTQLASNYELQQNSPMHNRTSQPLDDVDLSSDHSRDTGDRLQLLDSFQAKLELLFKAAWSHRFPGSNMISMVHGLAAVAAYCPPVIARLVVRGYPDMVSVTDHCGALPLHVALMFPNIQRDANCPFQQRRAHVVEQLLQAYPSAAQVAWQGRLPLIQAIASGYFWHASLTDTIICKGPLQVLWQAAPECLEELDPVTGLSPVLLAATTFANQAGPVNPEEQILQLDTLYNLLRHHLPDMLLNVHPTQHIHNVAGRVG